MRSEMGEGSGGIPTSQILFIVSLLAMLLLSVHFLYTGYNAYQEGSDWYTPLLTGMISLAATAYVSLQFRKKALWTAPAPSDVFTTTECMKCGFKNIRRFLKGDYVLKASDSCPKCEEPMTITTIYTEEKGKKESSG